jgi:hypothetical protein
VIPGRDAGMRPAVPMLDTTTIHLEAAIDWLLS